MKKVWRGSRQTSGNPGRESSSELKFLEKQVSTLGSDMLASGRDRHCNDNNLAENSTSRSLSSTHWLDDAQQVVEYKSWKGQLFPWAEPWVTTRPLLQPRAKRKERRREKQKKLYLPVPWHKGLTGRWESCNNAGWISESQLPKMLDCESDASPSCSGPDPGIIKEMKLEHMEKRWWDI